MKKVLVLFIFIEFLNLQQIKQNQMNLEKQLNGDTDVSDLSMQPHDSLMLACEVGARLDSLVIRSSATVEQISLRSPIASGAIALLVIAALVAIGLCVAVVAVTIYKWRRNHRRQQQEDEEELSKTTPVYANVKEEWKSAQYDSMLLNDASNRYEELQLKSTDNLDAESNTDYTVGTVEPFTSERYDQLNLTSNPSSLQFVFLIKLCFRFFKKILFSQKRYVGNALRAGESGNYSGQIKVNNVDDEYLGDVARNE